MAPAYAGATPERQLMNRVYKADYSHPKDPSIFFPDLIRIGIDLIIRLPSDLDPGQFRLNAAIDSLSLKRPRRLSSSDLSLALPVAPTGRLLGVAQFELSPRPCTAGIHCAGSSSLSFNPISLTRSLMFPDASEKSIGGQTNFVPDPDLMDMEFLGRTFDMTAHVVDLARSTLEGLLPPGCHIANDRAWLRTAEAAHDFKHPNAFEITQVAMHSALNQSRFGQHDVYQAGATHGRVPVARFKSSKTGEMTKVYPKTEGIVRVEISCPARGDVKKLCGTEAAHFIGDEIVELLDSFLTSAHEIGRIALGEVRKLVEGAKPLPELARCLHPLLLAAEGHPIPGGYRLKQTDRPEAERAYQNLMFEGRHWAKSAKPASSLRRLLDSLCAENGPLTKAPRGPWYSLKPQFAKAASGLARNGGNA